MLEKLWKLCYDYLVDPNCNDNVLTFFSSKTYFYQFLSGSLVFVIPWANLKITHIYLDHPLARHNDILTAIETRISLLSMTFMKYVDLGLCCFIPGKVIDEIFRVLTNLKKVESLGRSCEVLQVALKSYLSLFIHIKVLIIQTSN